MNFGHCSPASLVLPSGRPWSNETSRPASLPDRWRKPAPGRWHLSNRGTRNQASVQSLGRMRPGSLLGPLKLRRGAAGALLMAHPQAEGFTTIPEEHSRESEKTTLPFLRFQQSGNWLR
jgi:hypothetical protein